MSFDTITKIRSVLDEYDKNPSSLEDLRSTLNRLFDAEQKVDTRAAVKSILENIFKQKCETIGLIDEHQSKIDKLDNNIRVIKRSLATAKTENDLADIKHYTTALAEKEIHREKYVKNRPQDEIAKVADCARTLGLQPLLPILVPLIRAKYPKLTIDDSLDQFISDIMNCHLYRQRVMAALE